VGRQVGALGEVVADQAVDVLVRAALTAVEVHHDTDLYDLKVNTGHGTEVIHTRYRPGGHGPAPQQAARPAGLEHG